VISAFKVLHYWHWRTIECWAVMDLGGDIELSDVTKVYLAVIIRQQLKTSLSFYKIKIPSDKRDQQVQNCKRSATQAV
jgi:hypothetical protein